MGRTRAAVSVFAAGTALVLAAATGCTAGHQKPTLTVWIMAGTHPDASAYFADANAAFTESTGADVTVEFIPWGDAHDKFITAIAGNTAPDVAEVGTTWTPEFAAVGALADLGDMGWHPGAHVPGLVEAGTVDGRLYGVPWHVAVRAVLYRTDVFEDLGLEPPRTWAQLRKVARTIADRRPELTAFPVAGGAEYPLLSFIWGAGGEIALQNPDGTWTSGLDSPEAREGIAFLTGLARHDGVSSTGAVTWQETDVQDNFTDERVAMAVLGSWAPKAILAANPDLRGRLAAFPIPGRDGGYSPSFLGGSHLSIFEGSREPDLARRYVQLLTGDEYGPRWAQETDYFPGRTDQLAAFTGSTDPLVGPFAVQLSEAGKGLPVTPAYGRVQGRKILTAMAQAILSGEDDVEGASTTAADRVTQTLNEDS
ncbi:sugar ABC transporter substrate-binding protein [Nocardiopsis ansamitocini]|uniref:Sugar ABC transporter substrate-binding protein n=2 Tax=Nocardiopsis ansamitocini TaxID=1670832 RepID=A0A9W6P6K7_9ACTN|nr:sugar ABC transporter substrate-binding protein [Nocardiopsis ansamitocini]